MRKIYSVILALMGAVLLFSSCEHKKLCYNHTHGLPVRINVNWKNFPEEIPTGMTVIAYPESGKAPVLQRSNNIRYAEMRLQEDDYKVLVYNQSPSEFGYIKFAEMENFQTAAVTIVERTKSWYSKAETEVVAEEPEWFASGSSENLSVTKDMIAQMFPPGTKYGEVKSYDCDTLFPRTRIYKMNITVHVAGIKNLYSIRGSLNGMAGGCRIGTMKALDTKVTHLMDPEDWKMSVNKGKDVGTLHCSFLCFGLPGNHKMEENENLLKLSILLVDKKTVKECVFKVGKRFEFSTELDLNLDLEVGTDEDGGPVDLPDVDPADGGGGGFNVDVGGWGDPEIIEIEM